MGEYIVSARKYRPMTFDSVVGQAALTATLKNAVKSGKLAHAYLFCGPRGVGKTTCARIFAKAINCMNPTTEGEACGEDYFQGKIIKQPISVAAFQFLFLLVLRFCSIPVN